MNLRHLRVFDALAAAGSFTAAARRLGVSQPAVTIQVRELEQASGVRLIERRGRGVELTDAGRALQRVSVRVFALVDEAESVLAQAGGAVTGRFRISASRTSGAYLLPPVLTAFHRRHPAVRLRLEISNSRRVLADVAGFDADLGVLGTSEGTASLGLADDPRLVVEPFVREPLVLVMAPGHPWARRRTVGLGEIAALPLVVREPGSATRRALETRLSAAGLVPRIAMELGSNEAIKHAVAAGVGAGLLGTRVVADEVRAGRLAVAHPAGGRLAIAFAFVYHGDRAHGPALRAFLRLARARRPRR